jgi:hypothetical protein
MYCDTKINCSEQGALKGIGVPFVRDSRFLLFLVFLLALAIRLWFNFFFSHINNYNSCDASEYMRNADVLQTLLRQPVSFWTTCINYIFGSCDQGGIVIVKKAFAGFADFSISGPIFPIYIAIGNSFNLFQAKWMNLLFMQSIVSALTCVFIGIAGVYSFGKKEGICAAVISALYPGFIINSGRLYSETFACFLLAAILALIAIGFHSYNNYGLRILIGFLTACLQFTRSTMFVLTLALLPMIWQQNKTKRPVKSIVAFLIGFAIVTLPWLGLQKLALGSSSLVIDRVGHYNCFVGNNIDTGGWLSLPYPDGRGIEKQSFPEIIFGNVKKSCLRWGKLLLDKPARLLKLCWNDFRADIGMFQPWQQNLFHQIILLFAFIGISLGLFVQVMSPVSREQQISRLFIFALLLFHFTYCFFITVPRYNLTALPEIILFAAYGLIVLTKLLNKPECRLLVIVLLGLSAGLFFLTKVSLLPLLLPLIQDISTIFIVQSIAILAMIVAITYCLCKSLEFLQGNILIARVVTITLSAVIMVVLAYPARANGRWWEWTSVLENNQSISQQLQIDRKECPNLSDRAVYLLIDADEIGHLNNGLKISINGHNLNSPVIPGISLISQSSPIMQTGSCVCQFQNEGEYIFDCLSKAADTSNCNLRQWFVIPVDKSIVQEAASRSNNEIKFDIGLKREDAGVTKLFGSYDINSKYAYIPSLDLCSWEKAFYGVENENGLSDTRYDIKIDPKSSQTYTNDLSAVKGLQNGRYNIHILVAPSIIAEKKVGIEQSKQTNHNFKDVIMEAPRFVHKFIELDASNLTESPLWIMRLQGRGRKLSGQHSPYIEFRANYLDNKESKVYVSTWTPNKISMSNKWQKFDIAVLFNPKSVKGKLKNIQYRFSSYSSLDTLLNVNQPITHAKLGKVEFTDIKMSCMPIEINPLSSGHQIY